MLQREPTIEIKVPKRETRDKLLALIAAHRKDYSAVICDLIDAAQLPDQPPAPAAQAEQPQPSGKTKGKAQ